MKLLAPLNHLTLKPYESLEGNYNSEWNPSCSDNLHASRFSSLGPPCEPQDESCHRHHC